MIKLQIPATSANLGAGFDALGLALSFYNTAEMEENDVIDIRSLDDTPVPEDEKNLIYISAKDLYEVCGKQLKGLTLRQTNSIPMARGLGSSSACIIAGLVGANKMLGEPLSKDDLVDLAAQIEGHPDNTAPALLGGIVTAVFDGRKVHWVKQEVYTRLKFAAIIPDFELKTRPRAYDFRHHFAWTNLNRWAAEGLDLNVMLPYLMRYMGHQSVRETLYYFHFVPEFFPTYRRMAESLEDVIPEVPYEE